MKYFMWRKLARAVAYVELAMSIRAFLKTMIAVIATALMEIDETMIPRNETFERFRMLGPWCTWLVVLWFVGLHLWASLKLFSATKIDSCYCDALKKALIWRMVTYAFLFMELVGVTAIHTAGFAECYCYAFGSILVSPEVSFLWRGIVLYIASKYMNELETTLVPADVGAGAKAEGIKKTR